MAKVVDYATAGYFGDLWQKIKKRSYYYAGRGLEKWTKMKSVRSVEGSITDAFEKAITAWEDIATYIERMQQLAVKETSTLRKFENRLNKLKETFQTYRPGGDNDPRKYLEAAQAYTQNVDLTYLTAEVEKASARFEVIFSERTHEELVEQHKKRHPDRSKVELEYPGSDQEEP